MIELWREPWAWVVLAAILAVLEVILPGFILLGFAIGAAIMAVVLWIGAMGGSFANLVLVYAVISLVSWVVLRRVLGVQRGQVKIITSDINED